MAKEIDGIARPDDELKTSTTLQKLLDLWWRVCSKTGLSKLIAAFAEGILNAPIPKFDQNGKLIGYTSIGAEIGWNPANFARQAGELAACRALLEQIVTAQGIVIDPKAIEDAVERGAQKALDNLRIVNVAP